MCALPLENYLVIHLLLGCNENANFLGELGGQAENREPHHCTSGGAPHHSMN